MARIWVLLIWTVCWQPAVWGQVVFQDQFAGGKSSKWHQKDDGSMPANFAVQSGAYILSSSDSLRSVPRALIQLPSGASYFIQAQVQVQPLDPDFAAASLISYYGDSRHFYEFGIDGVHQSWFLQKNDKSGSSTMASGPFVAQQSVHRLGLYILGPDIRAFLDGQLVSEQSDSQALAGNQFGLSSRGARAAWQSVTVRISDPNAFSFFFTSKTGGADGLVLFSDAGFRIVSASGKALAGIRTFRIDRDNLAYYVFWDPADHFRALSGFADEFELQYAKTRLVKLSLAPSAPHIHIYDPHKTDWLMGLFNQTAKFTQSGTTVTLNSLGPFYLRNGSFVSQNGSLSDSMLGPAGTESELTEMAFGPWLHAGNYRSFPSVSGLISSTSRMVDAIAGDSHVPPSSKFNLVSLNLGTPDSPKTVNVSWLVQQDSRAFLIPQQANYPASLQAGNSYQVPVGIQNNGEAGGPFTLSIYLSTDSIIGRGDVKVGQAQFGGISAQATLNTTVSITIPQSVSQGHYFLGTFLESTDPNTRVRNSLVRAENVGDFPQNGSLEIHLKWQQKADLDLHIADPFRETVYYFLPVSNAGGRLVHDVGCADSGQDEVVSYPQGNASSGQYTISIHYFDSCGQLKDVNYTLTVILDGKTTVQNGVIHPGQYIQAMQLTR
jgi:hypothetical protein